MLLTDSGLSSYDVARWTDWVPRLSHVVLRPGLGMLHQTVPAHAVGNNETLVPGNTSNVLLFWTRAPGAVDCRLDGRPFRLAPKAWDFTVLPAGAASWWSSTPNAADGVLHLHVDASLLQAAASDHGLGKASSQVQMAPLAADPLVARIAGWLFDEVGRVGEPPRLLWDTAGMALALRLVQRRHVKALAPARGGMSPLNLKRTLDYLEARLAHDVTLAELAGVTGLSSAHLCRAFKQSMGLPPHRWLMARRMERAQDLLAHTRLPVTDVAAAVGYNDPGQFATAFRRATGASPSQYRKERRS